MSEEKQSVASETVSEQPTTETSTQSPDVGALIAESKKYRARAQDAEARIAKIEEEKLKEKEDFKTLYEKASSKIESLSSTAAKWNKYEETKRASLLEQHPENERETLANLPLETLEFVTSKINNIKPNVPEVIGRSKNVVIDKEWKDMDDTERRAFYESKTKG